MLDAVLDVFWAKGFSAASLEELAAAAGVSRPSLLAALGDKRSMYVRSLQRFVANLDAALGTVRTDGHTAADELFSFFLRSIELYTTSSPPRGCLVMCTAPAEAVNDEMVRSFLARVTSQLDHAFAKLLDRTAAGTSFGDPSRTLARARLATAVMQSLSLRARSGSSPDDLRRFAWEAVEVVVGVPPWRGDDE